MLKDYLKKLLTDYLENFDFISAEMLVMDDVLRILDELETEYHKDELLKRILCSIIEHKNCK